MCRIASEMAERGHEIMVRPSTPSHTTIRKLKCMQARTMGCVDSSHVRSEGSPRIGLVLSWLKVLVARGMPMKPQSECVRQDVHCGSMCGSFVCTHNAGAVCGSAMHGVKHPLYRSTLEACNEAWKAS